MLRVLHGPQASLIMRSVATIWSRPAHARPLLATMRAMSQQAASESGKFDPLDAHRRRLIYRAKQRGWLELDILLGDWSSQNLPKMSVKQLHEFEYILDLENPDLFKWLTGQVAVPEEHENEVFQILREHVGSTMAPSSQVTRTAEEWSSRQWWMEEIKDEA